MRVFVLAALVAPAALLGCMADRASVDAGGAPTTVERSIVGRWTLTERNGRTAGGVTLTLLASGRVEETAACNSFSGIYVREGAALRLGGIKRTALGCAGAGSATGGSAIDALVAIDTLEIGFQEFRLVLRSGSEAWRFDPGG